MLDRGKKDVCRIGEREEKMIVYGTGDMKNAPIGGILDDVLLIQ